MFGWLSSGVEKLDRSGGDGKNTLADGTEVHLALYKYDSCPFCRRTFSVIDSLDVNVEYRDVHADPDHGHTHRQRTGRSTVPSLYINDKPMFESRDINAWLSENFAEK